MSGTAGIKVKVKTEELVEISGEVEDQITAMRRQLDQIGTIIRKSGAYWEGEGQNAYQQAYRAKQDEIETALRRFAENVTDLRTIAGVYASAEASAVELTECLSSDVIV